MKSLILLCLCAACLTAPAMAAGPVVVVEEPEVKAESPSSKGWLPWLVVPLFLCVVLCGPDKDSPADQ